MFISDPDIFSIPDPDSGFGVQHGGLVAGVSSRVVDPDSLNPDPDPAF
jgi:hypothetical protein